MPPKKKTVAVNDSSKENKKQDEVHSKMILRPRKNKVENSTAAITAPKRLKSKVKEVKPATKAAEKAKAPKSGDQEKKTNKKVKAKEETNVESQSPKKAKHEDQQLVEMENGIYEFHANDISGNKVALSKYKGNVCIIVNVASKCGHTKSNYEQLVELYSKYNKSNGLKILAFPCNQFGQQEPGDSQKICEFVKKRNVEFDIFEKIDVNGPYAHPLWNYLKNQKAGPKGENIDWNFTKFVIDKEGKVVERYKPTMKPLSLIEDLEKLW